MEDRGLVSRRDREADPIAASWQFAKAVATVGVGGCGGPLGAVAIQKQHRCGPQREIVEVLNAVVAGVMDDAVSKTSQQRNGEGVEPDVEAVVVGAGQAGADTHLSGGTDEGGASVVGITGVDVVRS